MQHISHFEQLKPLIKEYSITKHFKRDVGGEGKATAIALDVLASNHEGFEELHKYEENIDGHHVFRAKIRGTHFIYVITSDNRLMFLRAFKNFSEYRHFLDDKHGIRSFL